MWFFSAVLSMAFVGVSTFLSKYGIKNTDPYSVGAITNTIILGAFAAAALVGGTLWQVADMNGETWISVILSGVVLSISWSLYYLGLKGGSISIFLAIQSLSVIFSMVLCVVFLKEEITGLMIMGTLLIVCGILLMTQRKELNLLKERWAFYSFLSALCAAVSYVIVKTDLSPIDTNVTSFFRYMIVTAVLWGLYARKGEKHGIRTMDKRSLIFILLGGAASAAGHVLVYKALFFGKAAVVMTIYRMGMVISVVLSKVFFREKLSFRGRIGFVVLVSGTVIFSLGR